MAYKIMLDPGHGGTDPGAVYEGRQEKDDALRLATAVGEILRKNGYDVEFTRTSDVYDTPFEKATKTNNAGADLFVSFHRNSAPTANQYSGVQSLVYDDSGLKSQLARNINANLTKIGFEDKGVVERPNLVVLKRTKMPAVLIEAGFINSDSDNKLFDEKFYEIANAIACAIMETLENYDTKDADGNTYTVQVGAFRNRQLANNMAYKLRQQGYPAAVIFENGLYKVQVGVFDDIDNAAMMEMNLRNVGYNTFIPRRY